MNRVSSPGILRFVRPADNAVRELLAEQARQDFSYAEVGATGGELPAGYGVTRQRSVLGHGAAAYERAVAAVRAWQMHALPHLELLWPTAVIAPGTSVAVLARAGPLWTLNVCRIVYTIDESGPMHRFGFAYGTLPAHAVRGEERFLVDWDEGSDAVSYDLLAFSAPSSPLLRAAAPLVRREQRRFAVGSTAAMRSAVAGRS